MATVLLVLGALLAVVGLALIDYRAAIVAVGVLLLLAGKDLLE